MRRRLPSGSVALMRASAWRFCVHAQHGSLARRVAALRLQRQRQVFLLIERERRREETLLIVVAEL